MDIGWLFDGSGTGGSGEYARGQEVYSENAGVDWEGYGYGVAGLMFEEWGPIPYSVTTIAAAPISAKRATLNLSQIGPAYDTVSVRFQYRQVGVIPWSNTPWVDVTEPGTHSAMVVTKPVTSYEFRGQLVWPDGSMDGDTLSFTTPTSWKGNINIDQLIYQHAERMVR